LTIKTEAAAALEPAADPDNQNASRRGMTMTIRSTLKSSIAAVLVLGAAGFGFATQAASADALADITKAGTINVGVFADFPPFSSASADMSLKGYDIDVAQYIADTLKVKLNPVAVTGQNRIPYLNDHRVDILMSVGYSKEREQVIDFAAAYAPYYIAVIGPAAMSVKGKEDLADKSIAVNRGTLEDTSLTEAAPASADIKRFDNYNAVIQAFISGQTQLMVVGNDVGAQVLAKQDALKPEQKFQLLTSPSHIGLNKSEDALKKAVNDAVAKMLAEGKLDESSKAWLKTPLNPDNLKD
jgi:polar amino acid transport system substrate-binding protein